MGLSITNFGRSGLHDWLVQRISAVVLALYTVFWVVFFALYPDVQFHQWQQLFAHPVMKVFNLLSLVSICAHAWIGLWTVSTDYIPITSLRFIFQIIFVLVLFVYLVLGIEIVWGV